jgi:hypothetical protein
MSVFEVLLSLTAGFSYEEFIHLCIQFDFQQPTLSTKLRVLFNVQDLSLVRN